MTTTQQPALRRSQRALLILFVLSLPFLNPWVRGDGVGYYAFARAPLIQHDLDFAPDYRHADASFRETHLDATGQPADQFRTRTGHLDNHFTVGPALLWSPFLLVAHAGVLAARALGSNLPADGFSPPYRITMALATAFYGFLGLLLSFLLARKYVEDRWALLATLAIWGASSFAVYMYFNPSWSHAHSAFTVALFLFYWDKTRNNRSLVHWLFLGAIAGLMLDVYYPNAMVLALLPFEAAHDYKLALRHATPDTPSPSRLIARHFAFFAAFIVCLLPTFVTRRIIYGTAFESGYLHVTQWDWFSPHFFAVLFSSDHGLFSWTPILFFAVIGLIAFWRGVPRVGAAFLLVFLAFYYFIASYPDWAGISSYGNRFFVSMTPLFIVGLAFFLDRFSRFFRSARSALVVPAAFIALFVLWNAGLMFQWGAHLIPVRGPISFSEMIHNQFAVVPRQLTTQLETYFLHRDTLMRQIEQRDLEQLKSNPPR